MNLPSSRKEAIEKNSRHYFTGKPCKRGHISKRLTSGFACMSCCKLTSKKHQAKARKSGKHREYIKRAHLKKTYNLTLEQYEEMEKSQKHLCAICKKPEYSRANNASRQIKRLAIDHCHKSNKVRDLLCSRCNGGLGNFFDSIEIMQKAIKYLTKWNKKFGR